MSFTIKQENCIEFIKELKNKGSSEIFDAIITDPPYNISKENNFKTIGRSGIDFGPWDYGFDQTTWIKEVAPLVKKGGSIIIFNDYKNFGEISSVLEECGFEIKDLLRWIKNNPMPRNTTRRYVTDYEYAIWATKSGGKWIFNKPDNVPYLRPEFKYPLVAGGKNKIHPTQKSQHLMEEIINIHTKVGDLIFDPFMGSGTTGAASLMCDRLFVGCEINKTYFSKALERLTNINIEKISSNTVIRSPLYYLGDKYKLLPQIIDKIPTKINKFFDVFGGGGTMLANISAKKYFYNDINKYLKSLVEEIYKTPFEATSKEINALIKNWKLGAGNKGEPNVHVNNYNELKKYYNELPDKSSHDGNMILFALIIFGFNSQIRFNSSNEFNIPIGKQDLNKNRILNLKKFQSSIQTKNIEFSSIDFEKYIKQIIATSRNKNDFIYFDPPYSITKATYNDSWSEEDDMRLFALLDELNDKGFNWAMSNVLKSNGKKNYKLDEWAKSRKYYIHELEYSYKNSNYRRKNKSEDCEVLICNNVNR
jgi:site-specific DNA-methyltransferase (adenine-specific)